MTLCDIHRKFYLFVCVQCALSNDDDKAVVDIPISKRGDTGKYKLQLKNDHGEGEGDVDVEVVGEYQG